MSLLSLEQTLNKIAEQGADRLDPLRFCYLQAMIRRAKTQRHAVRIKLTKKIAVDLQQYQSDCQLDPHVNKPLSKPKTPSCSLFDHPKKTVVQQLAELTQTLNQDQQALAATSKLGGEPPELKSLRLFRASWATHKANKLVAQAITKSPKNPGPLNSHALAVKSLTKMRELSPEYLQHFITYADTLLWLDENGMPTETNANTRGTNRSHKSGTGKKRPKPPPPQKK